MLLALALISVSAVHPRVYVRADSAVVGKGITVSELRARAKDSANVRWRAQGKLEGPSGIVERAARYLEEGDPGDLASVAEHLKTHTYSYEKDDVGGFLAGAEMALAFDWVYGGLTAAERLGAMDKIVTTCDSSLGFLERGEPDINHNYTYMALNTVVVCGLAMNGEAEPYGRRAREYLATAQRFVEPPGMVLDTWKARQGAWAEGSHYTFFETLRNLVMMMQAYRSASDTDYFTGRPWLAQAGRFLIGSTRPDLTFERIGDTSANRVQPTLNVPVTLEMLADGLDNAAEAARLRSFTDAIIEKYGDKAVHPAFQWGMRMFRDPLASREPSWTTLPLAMRMGEGTYEQIAWRNGWGPDSTLITILAGDHFTDHQHFDKGQFLVYQHGGLAVDSGAYDGMYKQGGHSGEYAVRTLAHNCVLVFDPAQDFKGYSNDGGQLLLRGLQHHGTWPQYLDHRIRENLHAAEVQAYEAAEWGNYVRIDLTRAYGPKVRSYQRSFVYLPGRDVLVVYDHLDSGFEKRWLLHFQDEPEIRDGVVTVRSAAGGTMVVRTLLPEKPVIEKVGGPGREFLNPFNQVNYAPSLAAAAAQSRESGNWRMEVVAPGQVNEFLHTVSLERAVDSRLVDGASGAEFVFPDGRDVVVFADAPPVAYKIGSGNKSRHVIAGVPPGAALTLEIDGTRSKVRADSQGIVRFDDPGGGAKTIRLKP
jgi:hypothetical protein